MFLSGGWRVTESSPGRHSRTPGIASSELRVVSVVVDVCVEHFFSFFVFIAGSSMATAESKNINQMGLSGVAGQ